MIHIDFLEFVAAKFKQNLTFVQLFMKFALTLYSLLVGWVLWHINYCRLFNAASILIHINSSISNNSV